MKDNFTIGIIGGAGAMGGWFAAFFREQGYTVHIAEKRSGMTIPEMASKCAVVIVSVPIEVTSAVIGRVGPLMKKDHLLMDLTSIKAEPMAAMLDASPSEVIGLHPLFGPDCASLSGQNVVICHGRGHRWLPWVREILGKNGACLVEASPEKHDEMMSIVQGLVHLNTILMGLTLREMKQDPADLDRYSTPAYRVKTGLLEKVFDQNPRLYAEIITRNPGLDGILERYERNFARMKELIRNRDSEGLATLLKAGRVINGIYP
jgi:prephenate dehydrogenase